MRSGMLLEALAERYAVFLLVIPACACGRHQPDEAVASRCAHVVIAPPLAPGRPLPDPASLFPGVRFRAVHVSRTLVAPVANPYLLDDGPDRPSCALDLPDFDSGARLSIAALYERNGDAESAALERETAGQYAELERHYLPLFDSVYACSEIERWRIARYCGAAVVRVVPNAIRLPQPLPAKAAGSIFTLLFTGNLAYYPNEDAVQFFCRDILPRLRNAPYPVRLLVAGRSPSEKLLAVCSRYENVSIARDVPDLAPYYQEADAVIVPIRAGGGTRIKILEACGYRRPVVSTVLGAEGLEAAPGREILIADSPQEFADTCLFLMRDRAAAAQIAAVGHEWVRLNHTQDNVRRALGI